MISFVSSVRVALATVLSTLVFVILMPLAAIAHEVMPAIADMEVIDGRLSFKIEANVEGIVAGVNLAEVTDTNEAPEAADYDRLRALNPDELRSAFERVWPTFAGQIVVRVGETELSFELDGVEVPEVGDPSLLRNSVISFSAPLPDTARTVEFMWAEELGAIVIRQMGVEEPYDAYLAPGEATDPIQLAGGDKMTALEAFVFYVPVGFEHIVPLGLDHILFVLGLFLLSTKLKPLLWQVSAFTLAHTVTLALAALGYVNAPGAIVEPLIAASIVFVAVENILTNGLSKWRPFIVFGFGLLHGLGFASVLGEYGLPEGNFIPALIGFNIGVEFGQLAVILAAFLAVGLWFGKKGWYRRVISVPASVGIALIGAYWFLERTVL